MNENNNSVEVEEIAVGNLYDMNKTLVLQNEKPLSKSNLREKISEIKTYFAKSKNKYFMLLNKENSDYTIFNFSKEKSPESCKDAATILIEECLFNRGTALSIDKNKDGAYEIWMRINNEAFVYYLFPYDEGVIEV